MRYLFIAPINICPNASAGAETINYYINAFAIMGNDIDVIAYTSGRYSSENITYYKIKTDNKIQNIIKKFYKFLGWILYPQEKYLYKTTPWLRKNIFIELQELRKNDKTPDVIMLETTSAILLYDDIKELFPNAQIIASLHDYAFQGSKRKAELERNVIKKLFRKRYLKCAEKVEVNALSRVDLICPHNAGNETILRRYDQLKSKKMIPIVPYYSMQYNHQDELHSNDIIFYGLMSRPENYTAALWFIDNVMPMLPEKYRFVVMGGKPIEKLKQKASSKILITGFLPEDKVKDYYEKSFCMVVPLLLGSGIKTKVLSALKCGLPVLSNNIGIEGIGAKSGVEYIHCESVYDYVQGLEFLSNKDNYLDICEKSRMMMNDRYMLGKCAKELNDYFGMNQNNFGSKDYDC